MSWYLLRELVTRHQRIPKSRMLNSLMQNGIYNHLLAVCGEGAAGVEPWHSAYQILYH
jgi:hypothetical protein